MALATAFAAAGLGWVVARTRPDLAIRPARAALLSGLVAAPAGAALVAADAAPGAHLLFAALAPLAVFDKERMKLPDDLTLPLIALGPLLGVLEGDGWDRALGAVLGFFSLRALGLFWRVEAMGKGDAKLFAAIGGFLGWSALPEIAFLGAAGAIAHALLRHGAAARREAIPFGPALIAGALISTLFGPVFGPAPG